jgi:hypothetical protein
LDGMSSQQTQGERILGYDFRPAPAARQRNANAAMR